MDIVMGWPEWIVTGLVALKIINAMIRSTGARPKDYTGNGAYAVSIITIPIIWFGLLYWGGFFS